MTRVENAHAKTRKSRYDIGLNIGSYPVLRGQHQGIIYSRKIRAYRKRNLFQRRTVYDWLRLSAIMDLGKNQESLNTLKKGLSSKYQALPAIAAMEIHGVCIDVARWRDILATRIKQKEDLEAQIQQILGNAL